MTGWSEFVLAMAAFLGSHFIPRLGGLRDRAMAGLGRRLYFSLYGLVSLLILAWVISAAGRAPYVELWPQAGWTRWAPNLAMPPAFVLAAMGIGLRQPHTLGAARVPFDPGAAGFAAVSRHPLLLALALWSAAHLLPNGDLAHVILFGSFALVSLAAIALFDAKARRAEGDAFFARTAILSLRPLFRPGWWRGQARSLGARAGLGLLAWAGLLHLHQILFGVAPFPPGF